MTTWSLGSKRLVMKLRTNSPNWFNEDHPEKEAKCTAFPGTREHDPWFGSADGIQTEDAEEMEDAKAVCLGLWDGRPCPLLKDCLEFAIINNERFGVWGGTTPDERRNIRKLRREGKACQDGGQSSQAA